jgi:hypothetical protein
VALTLKRDVLRELTLDELTGVNGAGETYYTCYAVISCGLIECLPTFDHCIE